MAVQAQIFSGFCSGGAQDMLMDNVCGSSSLFLGVPQQEQPQVYMQRAPFSSRNNTDNSRQSMPITFLSDDISAQIDNQRWELDQFLNSQSEMLRMALHEQRKQQTSLLLKSYEPKIQFLLNQKEEEITKARNRTFELEACLRRLEGESQGWQRAAKENEAIVAQLNTKIAGLREAAATTVDDTESCCDNGEEIFAGKSLYHSNDEERVSKKCRRTSNLICRSCTFGNSTVIMLPCRHLGSCRDCAVFLDACPVCNMEKKCSVEALF